MYCTDSPTPAPASIAIKGPLLRRGTINTAGGMPAPGGIVTRLSSVPSNWLARNVTGMGMIGSGVPR